MARSREWQIKFINSKELKVRLFLTDEPLTQLQESFIDWIRTYANVYETFSAGYYPILTEEVIETDLFLDAYFVWVKEDRKDKLTKQKDYDDRLKYQGDLKGRADEIDVTIFEPKE